VLSSSSARTLARRTALTADTQEGKRRSMLAGAAGLAALKADPRRRTGVALWSPRLVGPRRMVSFALVLCLWNRGLSHLPNHTFGFRRNCDRKSRVPSESGWSRTFARACYSRRADIRLITQTRERQPLAEPSHVGHLFPWSAGVLTSGVHPLGLRRGRNPAHFRRPKWH
jgi:hypothetical protein